MINMDHCRFHNTNEALGEILYALSNVNRIEDLSLSRGNARRSGSSSKSVESSFPIGETHSSPSERAMKEST